MTGFVGAYPAATIGRFFDEQVLAAAPDRGRDGRCAMTRHRHPGAGRAGKEFHFPLSVDWVGERRVRAQVEGKPAVEITPPPVFRGTDPSTWSPEDFFVAAAASCLAVTFTGLAERAGLAYSRLHVDADGVCGRRDDGRFGFTRMLLRLQLDTDSGRCGRGTPARRAGGSKLPRLGVARPAGRDCDRGERRLVQPLRDCCSTPRPSASSASEPARCSSGTVSTSTRSTSAATRSAAASWRR